MFPSFENSAAWDDFGEVINPDDYMIKEDNMELSFLQVGFLNKKTGNRIYCCIVFVSSTTICKPQCWSEYFWDIVAFFPELRSSPSLEILLSLTLNELFLGFPNNLLFHFKEIQIFHDTEGRILLSLPWLLLSCLPIVNLWLMFVGIDSGTFRCFIRYMLCMFGVLSTT